VRAVGCDVKRCGRNDGGSIPPGGIAIFFSSTAVSCWQGPTAWRSKLFDCSRLVVCFFLRCNDDHGAGTDTGSSTKRPTRARSWETGCGQRLGNNCWPVGVSQRTKGGGGEPSAHATAPGIGGGARNGVGRRPDRAAATAGATRHGRPRHSLQCGPS